MLKLLGISAAGETALAVGEIVVMFCLPAFVIWLTRKVKFFKTIGAVALCYAFGFVLAVLPIPYDKTLSSDVASILVALAIPLILFGFDVRSVGKLAKKTIVSFVLVIVSVMAVSSAAAFIGSASGMENTSELAGMTTGLYVGGTPNLIAIGSALLTGEVKDNVIGAANISDFFAGGIFLLVLLTVVKPVYVWLLDKRKSKSVKTQPAEEISETQKDENSDAEISEVANNVQDEYDYRKIPKTKKDILKLIGVILLAAACLGAGALIEILINGNMSGSLFIMIAVTVFGIAFSFIRPIRETKGSYQIGQYLILVFSLGLSMSIDFSRFKLEILPTLAFLACVQTASVLVHMLLCKVFKIDSGTAMITCAAGVYGPPFIAPVADAYGDKNLILPGVICSTFGLMIGNLLGIGLGALLGVFV